jgi:hypothetical protein
VLTFAADLAPQEHFDASIKQAARFDLLIQARAL